MLNFQVVDNPLAYSIFLGRPFLATTTTTIPMHYLFMKIPTLKYVIDHHEIVVLLSIKAYPICEQAL